MAKTAHAQGITLREAALQLRVCSAEQFDATVQPERMLAPYRLDELQQKQKQEQQQQQ